MTAVPQLTGKLFKHYKGNIYHVFYLSKRTETNEKFVNYVKYNPTFFSKFIPKIKQHDGIFSQLSHNPIVTDHQINVLNVSTHTETMEKLVHYEKYNPSPFKWIISFFDKNRSHPEVWSRPLDMFVENIEYEGKIVPRFEQLPDVKQ
jgi:hypothetical protein